MGKRMYPPPPLTGGGLDEPCIPYPGKARGGKYGEYGNSTNSEGQSAPAHRVAYEMAHQVKLGPEIQVDHLCRVKLCWNPDHLEAVTGEVNRRRAGQLRLGSAVRAEIQADLASGISVRTLASEHGVSYQYIWSIGKHVTNADEMIAAAEMVTLTDIPPEIAVTLAEWMRTESGKSHQDPHAIRLAGQLLAGKARLRSPVIP